MNKRGYLAGVGACFLLWGVLAGCASKDVETLKAFLGEPRMPVAGVEYRILPPDVVAVSSQRIPEIHGQTQQVRPDGKINLPLVGEIFVAGKTPGEVEKALVGAARPYYQEVDATVQVVGFNSQRIYVFGQVTRPGPQPWTGANTLLDVLAQSQPTMLAWPERIRLVRGKPPTRGGYVPEEKPSKGGWQWLTLDSADDDHDSSAGPAAPTTRPDKSAGGPDAGQPDDQSKPETKILTFDLMAMVRSGDLSRNVLLRPDDVVYVPPNPFATVGLALQMVLFPVRPVLEAVRVPSEVEGAARPSGGE